MGSKLMRLTLICGSVLTGLFLLRLVYGYASYPDGRSTAATGSCGQPEYQLVNYASSKIKRQAPAGGAGGAALLVDQKYEKVAALSSVSDSFEQDEARVRTVIKDHNALIQFEQNVGLAGSRCLHLAIGVHPDRFDEMIAAVRKVGSLASVRINKKDKTNEYRELTAKKESLRKTHEALLALKRRGGKIEEYMQLENRILEIEKEIQKYGVRLGEFDEENEFCTVKFTLAESSVAGISFPHRIKVAFEWTVKYGLLLAFLFAFAVAGLFIGLLLFERLRALLPSLLKNLTETNHDAG